MLSQHAASAYVALICSKQMAYPMQAGLHNARDLQTQMERWTSKVRRRVYYARNPYAYSIHMACMHMLHMQHDVT